MLHMTKEIKDSMELEKLEKRRDEINGYNDQINARVKQILEQNKQLNAEYIKLVDQYKVNMGALGEIQGFIDAIKKNEQEDKAEDIKVVEDSKKSKK